MSLSTAGALRRCEQHELGHSLVALRRRHSALSSTQLCWRTCGLCRQRPGGDMKVLPRGQSVLSAVQCTGGRHVGRVGSRVLTSLASHAIPYLPLWSRCPCSCARKVGASRSFGLGAAYALGRLGPDSPVALRLCRAPPTRPSFASLQHSSPDHVGMERPRCRRAVVPSSPATEQTGSDERRRQQPLTAPRRSDRPRRACRDAHRPAPTQRNA